MRNNNLMIWFLKKRERLVIFVVTALLLLTSAVLFNNLNYPNAPDAGRDYLIGRHIIQYNEFVLTGPINNVYGFLNSPLYFYLVSALLLIKDDILFLSVANIFLQILTVLFVCLLARELFGTKTMLGAGILFGLSTQLVSQTAWFWQPYVMPPFLMLSAWLLLVSYKRKKYYLLPVSLAVFLSAGALHMSAFSLTPLFLGVIFLVLRQERRSYWHYSTIVATAGVTFCILYSSTTFFLYKNGSSISAMLLGHTPMYGSNNAYTLSISQFLNRTGESIMAFLGSLFHLNTGWVSIGGFLIVITCACILRYFFSNTISTEQKIYMAALVTAVVSNILFFSFFRLPPAPQYFTAVIAFFIIAVVEAFRAVCDNRPFSKFFYVIPIVFLVYIFSGRLSIYRQAAPLRQGLSVPAAVYALKKEISAIRKMRGGRRLELFPHTVSLSPALQLQR